MAELYNIALCTSVDVKTELPEIPDSVDDSLFDSFIIKEGDAYIQTICGLDLYQEILLQYSTSTLTALNDYIYNRYIKKILIHRIAIRLIDAISGQIENSGYRFKISDQSREATIEEMQRRIQIYQNYVDSYTQDFIRYINDNIADYPLFYKSTYCTCNDKEHMKFGNFNMISF